MNTIVVERFHETPLDSEQLRTLESLVAQQDGEGRVQLRYAVLARDGSRSVSVYEAPEPALVRAAHDDAGVPWERVWQALILTGRGVSDLHQRRERVMVQRAMPDAATLDQYKALSAGAADCMRRHRASLLEAYLSEDGLFGLCHFEGIDAESVRRANLESQLPFTRAWSAAFHDDLGVA